MPPGNYDFSATVPGFKRYNRPGLVVQVAIVLRIDMALEAGLPQESVTVTEAAPLLTVSAGVGSHQQRGAQRDAGGTIHVLGGREQGRERFRYHELHE